MSKYWDDKTDNIDYIYGEDFNKAFKMIEEDINKENKIIEADYDTNFETNTIYKVLAENSMVIKVPKVNNVSIVNQILIYLKTTNQISITWEGGWIFVNNEIPTVGVGNYRIIAEFNPNISAWVVGTIQDGVAE